MSPSLTTPVVNDVALPETTPASVSHSALFSLANKTVAITGGGRGLGITLAGAVLEAGGHVACLDILPEPAADKWAALQKTAKASGLGLSYRRLDVTDEEALAHVFDDIDAEAAALGAPLYGCIACAGIQQKVPAIEYPQADFERIQRVNVTGTFLTAKHTARILVKNGVQGSIVLIASMSGQIANRVSNSSPSPTSRPHTASPIPQRPILTRPVSPTGPDLYRLQHQQGGRAANVPVARPGVGPVRHPHQYAVAGLHPHRHDRRAAGDGARAGEDLDGGRPAEPAGRSRRL